MKAIRKVEIEYMPFELENWRALRDFVGDSFESLDEFKERFYLFTLQGESRVVEFVVPGDVVTKEVAVNGNGQVVTNFRAVPAEVFKEKYVPIVEPAPTK